MAIVRWIRAGLVRAGLPEDAVQLIEDASRETTRELMRLNRYVDVLIPRGGAGLIKTVVENSTIPVIETGTGNCHIYVDASADLNMALDIIFQCQDPENRRLQRTASPWWCTGALQRTSCHFSRKKLEEKQVEIRADEDACAIEPSFAGASRGGLGTGISGLHPVLKAGGLRG
ncbi:MAG: hypothetical protein ACLTBV_23135 [Enterocloster bolteae]